jgi:hypothetical protein
MRLAECHPGRKLLQVRNSRTPETRDHAIGDVDEGLLTGDQPRAILQGQGLRCAPVLGRTKVVPAPADLSRPVDHQTPTGGMKKHRTLPPQMQTQAKAFSLSWVQSTGYRMAAPAPGRGTS